MLLLVEAALFAHFHGLVPFPHEAADGGKQGPFWFCLSRGDLGMLGAFFDAIYFGGVRVNLTADLVQGFHIVLPFGDEFLAFQ